MKIYAPVTAAALDWCFGNDQITTDLKVIESQQLRIAAVPAIFNQPHMYCFRDMPPDINLQWFDLVLISDIEYYSQAEIVAWIESQKIKNYLLAIGGQKNDEDINVENTVYRPWWVYNCLRFNEFQPTDDTDKPFQFEMLLGARRPHRDFAMLSFQQSGLLEYSIVTYRDIFQGHCIDRCSENIANIFAPLCLQYPYVSPNLDPAWETSTNLNFQISPYIPWEIYRRTKYSVLCETLGMGETFFMSEKAAKVFFGKRLFVAFAPCLYLENLRQLGFKTFGDVIDESYDTETNYIKRYQMAFEQIRTLHDQDADAVMEKIHHVLDHNHNRLFELQTQTRGRMQQLLQERISGNIVN